MTTTPVVEHVQLPSNPAIVALLRRPDPIEEPSSVRAGGTVTSATLKVGNMRRDVHFYVPNKEFLSRRSLKGGSLPLLIAFHGSTEHGMLFRSSSSSYAYDQMALEHGCIVAYPDGYKGNWNDGRLGSNFPAVAENVDDIAFVSAIIEYCSQRFGTDQQKTLAIGYSNGGQFLLRMLYEPKAPVLAGIGTHCVTLPEQSNNKIRVAPSPKGRVPVVMVNSMNDPVSPYHGGLLVVVRLPSGKTLGDRGLHMSSMRTARVVARNWEMLGVSEEEDEPIAGATRQDWTCRGRPVVRLVSMIGEGHHVSVPGGSKMPLFLGPALETVHAPREVMRFFKTATQALS